MLHSQEFNQITILIEDVNVNQNFMFDLAFEYLYNWLECIHMQKYEQKN